MNQPHTTPSAEPRVRTDLPAGTHVRLQTDDGGQVFGQTTALPHQHPNGIWTVQVRVGGMVGLWHLSQVRAYDLDQPLEPTWLTACRVALHDLQVFQREGWDNPDTVCAELIPLLEQGIADAVRAQAAPPPLRITPPVPDRNSEAHHATLDNMERMGGGFVRALAVAWRKADPQNHARLHSVFGDYYGQYARGEA